MLKSRLLISLAIIISMSIFICGCKSFSPQSIGISEQEWATYDKVKQQKVLSEYNATIAQNADVDAEDQFQLQQASSENRLQIYVYGGLAMLPPYIDWSGYQPANFSIDQNSCSEVTLLPENIDPKVKLKYFAKLRACYKNNKLFIDPSIYDQDKKEGTVTFTYSPLWEQGFIYHNINTTGTIKFKNATIKISNTASH